MNLRKQQMHLQLQQQQQPQPYKRQNNRTGFEALLDQPAVQRSTAETSSPGGGTAWSPDVGAAWSPGGGTAWSPGGGTAWSPGGGTAWSPAAADTAGRYRHHHIHRYDHDHSPSGSGAEPENGRWPTRTSGDAAAPDGVGFVDADATAAATTTTPPPPSPLSLPSPYYDRNPIVGFPQHNHQHHHAPKSPVTAAATVPLANVQNVVHAGADQDHHHDHYANNSKYYYQRQHHKSSVLADERDDDKENIKQRDAECLQQQLDEVLRACVDYEERNKNRQLQPATMSVESSGSTSPGSATTTTPPQQNRIKTNGSLPRDTCKKNRTETSSPTATLSPTSPLSQLSVATLSPSSMTWTSTSSPPTLSPLSMHANGADVDSVFLENDHSSVSSSAATTLASPSMQKVATCGSPRTRIRTLLQPSPAAVTTNAIDDSFYGSNKDYEYQLHRRQHNGDGKNDNGDGLNVRSNNYLSPASLQSVLQSPSQPSWQTTTTWLRSSPFTAADAVDGGATSTAATVSGYATEKAAEQRRKLLVELSAHKSRLVELHLRREEVDRELIIETALLRAELDAADDETRQSDNIVDGLDRAVSDCRQQMDLCTVKQQEQRMAADLQLATHRRALQGLRSRLETVGDDDRLKNDIRASIDKQTELLETEQKLYEDVEFGLLEEEAGWLARREELHRDRAAAVAIRRARRARAEWLRAQIDQLRSVGEDQIRALRTDINTATLSIQQGHKKLQDLDTAAGGTTGAGQNAQDQYRRHRFMYDSSTSASDQQQPPKSLEWPWDQQLKSPVSPFSSSSLSSWDQQSKSPGSPWSPAAATIAGIPSTPIGDPAVANNNGLMTNSMTTTCCSSIGSEDDVCRPISEDSTSRMSMSTICDGGATIKLRPKNKSSPSDITKRPLTRYLPVRYDGDDATENRMAFDLRAHIESAGHQLDDEGDGADNRGASGRHFWIDSSSCRGYLKKLSGAGSKGTHRSGRKWLKRWFVFDRRTRTLCYYHHRSDEDVAVAASTANLAEKKTRTRPRASIRFQDIQEVYVDHTNSSKGQGCAFVVKTAQRTFYLSAATGQAVRVWVDVIFTGAEGYREYLKGSTGDGKDGDRRAQQTKS